MKKPLSTAQLVILLFFCRHYSLLTYTNSEQALEASLYAIVIADIINLLFLIPVFLLLKKNHSRNLMAIAQDISPFLNKLIYLVLFVFFILTTFISLTEFGTFMTTTLCPTTSSAIILFSMLIFCMYAAINGLETIAKTASLLLPMIIIGILLITFFSMSNIDFDNFRPILENPILTIIKRAWTISIRNIELVALIYLLPFFNGSNKKVVGGFLGSYTVSHALLIFMTIAVLGEYAYVQQYPSYSIATVAKFSIFQRLDSLYMGIWVFTGFIRISLNLWLSIHLLKYLVPAKYHKFLLLMTSIILFIVSLYRNYFFNISLAESIFLIHTVLFITCLIFFPLLLLIIQKIFKKESYS